MIHGVTIENLPNSINAARGVVPIARLSLNDGE